MRAVRAARVMSALEDAGLAPAQLGIVGEADKPAPRSRGKQNPQGKQGKKAAAAPADQLDLQVEPE